MFRGGPRVRLIVLGNNGTACSPLAAFPSSESCFRKEPRSGPPNTSTKTLRMFPSGLQFHVCWRTTEDEIHPNSAGSFCQLSWLMIDRCCAQRPQIRVGS